MMERIELAGFMEVTPIASLGEVFECAIDFASPQTRSHLLLRYLKSPRPLDELTEEGAHPWLIVHYVEALKFALAQCRTGDPALVASLEPFCHEIYSGIISAVDRVDKIRSTEAVSIAQVSLFLAVERLDLAVTVIERLLANADKPLPYWVFVHLERFLAGRLSSPTPPSLDGLDEALAAYVSRLSSIGFWLPLPRIFSSLVLNPRIRCHFERVTEAMRASHSLSIGSSFPYLCILPADGLGLPITMLRERLLDSGCLALEVGSRFGQSDARDLNVAAELNYGYPAVFVAGVEGGSLLVDAGKPFLKTLWDDTPIDEPEVTRSVRLYSRGSVLLFEVIEVNVDELRRIAYSVKSSF
jgi:hypothetical protein